jgi:hypothetical protein
MKKWIIQVIAVVGIVASIQVMIQLDWIGWWTTTTHPTKGWVFKTNQLNGHVYTWQGGKWVRMDPASFFTKRGEYGKKPD